MAVWGLEERRPRRSTVNLRTKASLSPLLRVGRRQALLCLGLALFFGTTGAALQAGDIHDAARLGDVTALADLLDKKSTAINSVNDIGETPLHTAVQSGTLKAVKLLIGRGAGINARDTASGSSAILIAAMLGHKDIVETLISAGADVNLSTFRGTTALHVAAHEGRIDVAQLLLKHGANLQAVTASGLTPLDMAVNMNRQAMVTVLSTANTPRQTGSDALPPPPTHTNESYKNLQRLNDDLAPLSPMLRELSQSNHVMELWIRTNFQGATEAHQLQLTELKASVQALQSRLDQADSQVSTHGGNLPIEHLQSQRVDLTAHISAIQSATNAFQAQLIEIGELQQRHLEAVGRLSNALTSAQAQWDHALHTQCLAAVQSQTAHWNEIRARVERIEASRRTPPPILSEDRGIVQDSVLQTLQEELRRRDHQYAGHLSGIEDTLQDVRDENLRMMEELRQCRRRLTLQDEQLSRLAQSDARDGGSATNTVTQLEALTRWVSDLDQRQGRLSDQYISLRAIVSALTGVAARVATTLSAPPAAGPSPLSAVAPPPTTLIRPTPTPASGFQPIRQSEPLISEALPAQMPATSAAPSLAIPANRLLEPMAASFPETATPQVAGNRPFRCIVHVHTAFSSGRYTLPELTDIARTQKVDAIFLTDSWIESIEYGLFPLRHIFWAHYHHPSVSIYGAERYRSLVQKENQRQSDVLYIPGVELVPRFYWSGTLLNPTCNNHQRNLLVLGMPDLKTLRSLPLSVGYQPTRDWLWVMGTRLTLLLLLISVLATMILPRILSKRSGIAAGTLTRSLMTVCLAPALGLTVLVNLLAHFNPRFDVYSADNPEVFEQHVLNHLDRNNCLSFWAHPEASDHLTFHVWGIPIKIETLPYLATLAQTSKYTGFAGINEGANDLIAAGSMWDTVLNEYLRNKRRAPVWCMGEMLYHYEGQAGKSIDNVETVIWSAEKQAGPLLASLKAGRFYARHNFQQTSLDLAKWTVNQASSGETVTNSTGPLTISLRLEASEPTDNVEVCIIRNGQVIRQAKTQLPAAFRFDDTPPPTLNKLYYRVLVQGKYPLRLASNPIFVHRQEP